jgi:hypothetical protein
MRADKKLLELLVPAIFFGSIPFAVLLGASAVEPSPTIKACLNTKTGVAKVIDVKKKCLKTEKEVRIGVPVNIKQPSTILNGTTPPVAETVAADGDFYIDTNEKKIYGPRTSGLWGDGTSLVGPTGGSGSSGPGGPTGATGPQGNPGITTLGYNGSFYSSVAQTATALDTPTAMTYNVTDFANGISIVDGSKITIANAGKYSIAFSAQLLNAGNTVGKVSIWLRKNGTNLAWTNTDITLGRGVSDERAVAAWNFFINASAGDNYELMWRKSTSTDISILATDPNGIVPGIPSIILTVNQVG